MSAFALAGLLGAGLAAAGCGRGGDETQTVSQAQSQTAQTTNQPVTVSGCLKSGASENTYVLSAARTAGSQDTATYELQGSPSTNFQEHVGQRVEVSGTIESQQEFAARTKSVAGEEDRPTGTSGTPTVVTKAEIDIRRLSVSEIRSLAEKCDI
jgi:hypothetical protein